MAGGTKESISYFELEEQREEFGIMKTEPWRKGPVDY